MKVLIVGSLPGDVAGGHEVPSDREAVFQAANALGWALGEANHRVIVGSAARRTVDPYVVDGLASYCRENPRVERHLEIHFPADDPDPTDDANYAELPPNLHVLKIEHQTDASSPHRWIVAHFKALELADALVTIGGGVSTRLLGRFAAGGPKPVLCIREYGGGSAEYFDAVMHGYHRAIPRFGRTPSREVAGEVVVFLQELVEQQRKSRHFYFVSYSRKNCVAADIVELVLRKANKTILRDDADLRIGQSISAALQASMQQADTFIALWSQHYQDSAWCPAELDFALDSRARSGHPARVAVLNLDGSEPPFRAAPLLWADGSSHDLLHLEVRRLIAEERSATGG